MYSCGKNLSCMFCPGLQKDRKYSPYFLYLIKYFAFHCTISILFDKSEVKSLQIEIRLTGITQDIFTIFIDTFESCEKKIIHVSVDYNFKLQKNIFKSVKYNKKLLIIHRHSSWVKYITDTDFLTVLNFVH